MVKKLKKLAADDTATAHTGAQLANSVKESAQQIWLAGLGAFSKAQAEGGKVFETLVKDGLGLQRKTQAAAEEKINEATSKMTDMASDITSKATGKWDKLENIFEDRVAKALNKLGVPSAKDVQALKQRVEELSKQIHKTPSKSAVVAKSATKPSAKSASKPATKPAVKKTVVAKKATKPAAKRAPVPKAD